MEPLKNGNAKVMSPHFPTKRWETKRWIPSATILLSASRVNMSWGSMDRPCPTDSQREGERRRMKYMRKCFQTLFLLQMWQEILCWQDIPLSTLKNRTCDLMTQSTDTRWNYDVSVWPKFSMELSYLRMTKVFHGTVIFAYDQSFPWNCDLCIWPVFHGTVIFAYDSSFPWNCDLCVWQQFPMELWYLRMTTVFHWIVIFAYDNSFPWNCDICVWQQFPTELWYLRMTTVFHWIVIFAYDNSFPWNCDLCVWQSFSITPYQKATSHF